LSFPFSLGLASLMDAPRKDGGKSGGFMFNTVRPGGWCGPDIETYATAGKVADDHLKGDHQESEKRWQRRWEGWPTDKMRVSSSTECEQKSPTFTHANQRWDKYGC